MCTHRRCLEREQPNGPTYLLQLLPRLIELQLVGTFKLDFVTTDANGRKVRPAGCDLLQIVGNKIATKNAFRKQRG